MNLEVNKLLRFVAERSVRQTLMYAAMILAASAMPSFAMADSTENGTTNVITGVQDLTGKTLTELKAGAVTAGTYPTDDMDKIFFLYNVKTGKFLNAGGYWGTHVSLQEVPLSLWVNASTSSDVIDFSQSLGTGQGHLLRWTITNSSSTIDQGIFIDRGSSTGYYGWTLEAVSDDSLNTYKLYTYKTASPSTSTEKYYLCAHGDETDQDKNCEAYTASDISTNNLSGYDTWRVFSMQQIMDLQDLNTDNMTSSLELSFKLKCPGFARGNDDITSWTTSTWGTGTSSGLRFGLEKYYSTTAKVNKDVSSISSSNTYTFEGTTYSSANTYQQQLAKYFCADAKNVRGVIYQDVQIKHGGSYVVECKGYSNTTDAKLFAVLLDKDKNVVKNTVHETVLNQIDYMSETEQTNLHTSEQSMDYAGKNFYGSHKYKNTVLVHAPELTDTTSYYYVRFGILIGEDETDTTVDGDNEWTVFDDFRLLYASKTIDEDLILDEDRADMSYLSDCSNTYSNKVLHLNKTFTRNTWNSFVLPVSLTTDQFRQAFGANARLAKLSELTSSEIKFSTVNLDNMSSSDTALIAYTPYIIFPTRYIASKESPAYKALLTETGNTEAKTKIVIVKANNVEIPNVSFATSTGNKNDLSNIDTDTWTTKKMYNVEGNGTMTACGTFVRTFGPDDTTQDTDENSDTYGVYTFGDDKGTIISGRDDLKGSFFFWNGNLYSSNTRVRGLRGFSCWFKPTSATDEAKMTMYIDGVAQDATADISDQVVFGKDETLGKAARGIFNISGQRISDETNLANLPAGIYIVNGKKHVVR